MATDSDALSVHNTLTGTTADTVTIGAAGTRMRGLEVANPSASAAVLYFTWSSSATAPTAAVSAANGTVDVLPGGATYIEFAKGQYVELFVVSVVGNGNAYSVRGVRA